MEYRVIEQKEILHEAFVELHAYICRIMDRTVTEAERKPLEVLKNKISILWHGIISEKYSTMEDMYELRGQYKFIKSYLEALE